MLESLVQLLVADLDWAALATLVLEEAKEGSGQDGEHDDVAWRVSGVRSDSID